MDDREKIDKFLNDFGLYYRKSMESYGTFSVSVWRENFLRLVKQLGWKPPKEKPLIVCFCGSTRFGEAFQRAELEATLDGKIVLTIGCNMRSDTEIFGHLSESELKAIKVKLDELHLRKIDLANEVMILNVGGYIGESTRNEIEYAQKQGKKITYLEKLPFSPGYVDVK